MFTRIPSSTPTAVQNGRAAFTHGMADVEPGVRIHYVTRRRRATHDCPLARLRPDVPVGCGPFSNWQPADPMCG